MTTLFAVAFLILFAGMLVLFALQSKLRHLHPGGPMPLRLDSNSPRTRLRAALMGDEAKVQRLVDYERRLNPSATQRDAEQSAYQRWLRDQGR
jgi:hypothetical protein